MFQRRHRQDGMLTAKLRCALALAAVAVMSFALPGAWAAEPRDSIFAVRDVAVDATAAAAAAARDQALAAGQRAAFGRLLARLTLARDAARLPKPSEIDLADLLEGYEVQSEKNSPVRYIATLSYQFKRRAVEDLLREKGVAFAETPSKPVLVLPVLHAGDTNVLWDDPNPWRAAWANLPQPDGLVPFLAPIGDLKDIGDVSAQDAVDGKAEKLAAIAARYGAGSTLVVTAAPHVDASGAVTAVDLTVSRQGTALAQPITVASIAAEAGETVDALYTRAARQVETEVTERWKEDNLLHFDQAHEAVISVPIAALADWLKVRRRLSDVAIVSRIDLIYLARKEARVDLHYLGDPSQLKLAFAQRDLLLTEDAGALVVHPAENAAAAATN